MRSLASIGAGGYDWMTVPFLANPVRYLSLNWANMGFKANETFYLESGKPPERVYTSFA
jgi:hypothetical protein